MNRTKEKSPPRVKIGDEVFVTPWRFNGKTFQNSPQSKVQDLTENCQTVRGVVVHITGPFGNSAALFTVKLLEDAGLGWYAGDTFRARAFQLTPGVTAGPVNNTADPSQLGADVHATDSRHGRV